MLTLAFIVDVLNLFITHIHLKGGICMGDNNIICIYNETGDNIEDIMLKIYNDFVNNEFQKVFKT